MDLTARRLHRELPELGHHGGYTILTDFLREIRPIEPAPFASSKSVHYALALQHTLQE